METEQFLRATAYIDCDAEPVKRKSQEIVQGISAQRDKAVRIFYAVRDGIKYTISGQRTRPEHFRASTILSAGEGYCVQKAILLVAFARQHRFPHDSGLQQSEVISCPKKCWRREAPIYSLITGTQTCTWRIVGQGCADL